MAVIILTVKYPPTPAITPQHHHPSSRQTYLGLRSISPIFLFCISILTAGFHSRRLVVLVEQFIGCLLLKV